MKTESMLLVPELAFEENLYSRAEEVVKVLSSFGLMIVKGTCTVGGDEYESTLFSG